MSAFTIKAPAPARPRLRPGIFLTVLLGHVVLILLFLQQRLPEPQPVSDPPLRLVDLPIPLVAEPPPPLLIQTPQEAEAPPDAPSGGSDAGAPTRPIAPALNRPLSDAPDVTPLVSAPPLPAPSFSGATEASAGRGIGAGDGAQGNGKGNGSGDLSGGGSGAGGERTATLARWVRIPRRDELNRHLPFAFTKQRISGEAYLMCTVLRSRRVRDCRVLKETPAGSGIGAAAIAASPTFLIHPPRVNGKALESALVLIPIFYNYRD